MGPIVAGLYRVSELPPPAQSALYDLGPESEVPGHQWHSTASTTVIEPRRASLPASQRGRVEILERTTDTVHLRFDGIDVSIFMLDTLAPFVEQHWLNVTGLLATKLHAILDRGARRDFFDLYVTLQRNALGIAACLAALRQVFRQDVNDGVLLTGVRGVPPASLPS
jgi:hypothetical protein